MKRHRRTNETRWECRLCNCFQAISLRTLLNHYNKVHGNEPNFRVVCSIEECPAIFTKYNSLYKHITRSHKEVYDDNIEDNADAEFNCNNENDIDMDDGSDADICINNNHVTVDSPDDSSSAEELEMDMDENQNVDNIDITKSAASFLLKVKERNKIPQVAMESIMDSTRTLVKQVVDSVKVEVLNALDSNEQKGQVKDMFESATDPFAGIETEALQSKYIKQNFSYVEPKDVTHGLLPCIEFVNVYKVSWIKLFGTKFAKSGIIAIDVAGDPAVPVFGVIVCIWSILDFTYFDVQLLQTLSFDEKHQAYHVVESTEDVTSIYPYDSLVDFNVFHCKKDKDNNKYIPVKYDLGNIIEEHIEGRNPLH